MSAVENRFPEDSIRRTEMKNLTDGLAEETGVFDEDDDGFDEQFVTVMSDEKFDYPIVVEAKTLRSLVAMSRSYIRKPTQKRENKVEALIEKIYKKTRNPRQKGVPSCMD